MFSFFFLDTRYLDHSRMTNSDPPAYEFRWGARAKASVSKMKVLRFIGEVSEIASLSGAWFIEPYPFMYLMYIISAYNNYGAITCNLLVNFDRHFCQSWG